MKFIIDAQLPRRLAHLLRGAGHDVVHTLDLPHGNSTTDKEIIAIAEEECRVVVTKDADFVEAFVLTGQPRKLLVVATGNISNQALDTLVCSALPQIIAALSANDYIELQRTMLIIHQ